MSLVYCHRCDARFDPSVQFVRGSWPKNDTSGAFNATSVVTPGDCPICNKPPQPAVIGSGR